MKSMIHSISDRFWMLCCIALTASYGFGQNVVVSGALVGNGSYATLTAAFAAINGGVQTNATITVSVVGNTTEGPMSAVLNQGAWTSLTLSPAGARTVSGTMNAGSACIRLNGADRVTIDGLNSSGNSLLIQNTTVHASLPSAAILLENDASQNLVTRCTLQGSALGVVEFGGGTVTGNDDNTVSLCDIGPAGGNLPRMGILSYGQNDFRSNSGITITQCTIHDCFSPNNSCYGISLSSGHTAWTISNNRIYQTAPRVHTQASRHAGISIGSGPANSTVNVIDNVIGYNNANGTGSYTLTGVAGTMFTGILVESNASSVQTTITGNKVTHITINGAMWGTGSNSPFAGIDVMAGAANVNGNRVGSLTDPGAIQFSTSAGTTNTTELTMIRASGTGACNFLTDTIGGIVVNSPNNCDVLFDAIKATPVGAGPNVMNNNVIGSATAPIDVQTTGTYSRMNGINADGGTAQIQNNLVHYMTIGGGTSTTGIASTAIGIRANCSGSSQVNGNTVQAIGISATSGQAELVGICFNGSQSVNPANLIDGNKVQNLIYACSSGVATGIFNQNGKNTLQNNTVRLGMDLLGNSIVAGTAWVGIRSGGGTHAIRHNSVYIGGTGISGTQNTYAFNNDVPGVSEILNNIFMNARSNGSGTGKHYAIRLHGSSVNSVWNYSDYNNIVTTGTGGVFGYFAGADRANIYHWRNDYGHDAHSLSTDAAFVNPMGSVTTGDLHLGPITAMEGAGTYIAATVTDIDGQTRSGLTPNDIGADAANVASVISVSPAITYSAPSHYCLSGDLTITANIALTAGVPTAGGLRPKVYYRKNDGPTLSSYGTLTAGTGTNGTWTFGILAASMGGVLPGDIVSYYVIAQDVSGAYVSGNPGRGLVATDVNTVTRHPWEWNTYGGLQGNYRVGSGQTFTTLKGAVEAYNRSCLLGPVRFALKDTVYYYESFPISVQANPDASALMRLTIQPDSAVVVSICGESPTYLIACDGADYVTLNGSNTQMVNEVCPRIKAQRHLKLRNTDGYATVAFHNTALGDSATHNTLQNCRVYGGRNTDQNNANGFGAVFICGATPLSPGNRNNFNVIENNYLSYASVGIHASGGSNKNQGNAYRLNDIGLDLWVQDYGIMSLNENAPVIHANHITTFFHGVSLGYNYVLTNTSTTGSEVTNADVRYNVIRMQSSTLGASSSGIAVAATSSGTTTLANNVIQNVIAAIDVPCVCASIYYGGGSGLLRILHNTVRMTNSLGLSFYTFDPMMAVAIAGNAPLVDMRNNILHVAGNNGCLDNNVIGLGYTSTVGAYQNLTSNYNDLVQGSGTPYIGRTSVIGPTGPTYTTRAAWTAQTGADANSVTITPNYLSGLDSHLPAANNLSLNNQGMPLLLITDDMDCELRNPLTPDMGADEMETCPPPVAGTISSSMTFCGPGSATLLGNGYSTGSQYRWQSSPAGLNTWTNTTGTSPSSYATGTLSSSTDFRLQVGCANGTIVYTNVITITIQPIGSPSLTIAASAANPLCPGASVTFTATAVNAGTAPTYQWLLNGAPVGTNSPTYLLALPTSGDQVSCTITANAPCLTSNNAVSNTLMVTVMDNTAPTWANCPGNQMVSTQANSCDAVVNWNVPTASDNCMVASTTTSHNPGATFPIGTTTIDYAATDVANNVATCSFTVTVTDQVAPTALCQNFALQLDTSGQGSITAADIDSGSSDNCGLAGLGVSNGVFGCADVGSNTVVLTVTDSSGNTATCAATVVISAPAFQATASVVTTACGYETTCAGLSDGSATAQPIGGCPPYSFSWSNSASTSTVAGLGVGTYAVTVTDGAGQVQVLSVTITSPAPLVVQAAAMGSCPGDSTGSVSVSASGGNDCQLYTFQWSNGGNTAMVTGLGVGTYAVTVTDMMGCSVTQSATVTALPTPVPTVVQNGNLLSSGQVWASYQWLFNGNNIPGANASTYTLTQSGTYALSVTDTNGCVGVSNPMAIVGVATAMGDLADLGIYPNPTRDAFNLLSPLPIAEPLTVTLTDMYGKQVLAKTLPDMLESVSIDIKGFAAGTYLVEVTTDSGMRRVFRLVVQ